jgi:magnesium transporter
LNGPVHADPDVGTAEPTVRTRAYRDGAVVAEDFALAEISDHLAVDGTVLWVDLCGPSDAQLAMLADELDLHELAVEDALGPHQRPKVDYYASHLFLACHSVKVDPDQGRLAVTELDAFIDKRWMVTVRKNGDFPIDAVVRRWDRSPDLAHCGVGFLLYGLLDIVIDGYFDAVQTFDDFYDEVSEGIFSEHPIAPSQQRHWFQMRQSLTKFHRIVVPLREVVSGLMRREHDAVHEHLTPYYQDLYDHILRVTESTDALRDLVSTIVETNLSLRDYRTNQVMKKVTSWAAIIAVPTLITGFYGMNVPYPGSGSGPGVLAAGTLMVSGSAALYVVFKRNDWL